MNTRTPEGQHERGRRGDGRERLEEAGKAGASAARDTAREKARETAQSRLDEGKSAAGEAAASTARALDEAASSLSAQDQESLARVTSSLAEQLSRFARNLEERNVDELSRDARRLAREHPGLFVAGGVALGLAMGRFFKASGERRHASHAAPGTTDREADERWLPDESTATGHRGAATNTGRAGDGPGWMPNS